MLNLTTILSPVALLLAGLGRPVRQPHVPVQSFSTPLGEFPCEHCGTLQSEEAPLCIACRVELDEAESLRAMDAHQAAYAAADDAWFLGQIEQTCDAPLTLAQRLDALQEIPTLEADLHLELRRLAAVRQGHTLVLTGHSSVR